MSAGKEQKKLEERLGYRFNDPALLHHALTHSSYTNESRVKHKEEPSNERLEFLGDSVLQILISECLYSRYPQVAEGVLTKFRQHLVCEGMLASVARRLDLGSYLCLGNGEEAQGRERASILADAFEALLAAVYLDAGENGLPVCRMLLLNLMNEDVDACGKSQGGDFKTRLQQIVQQDGAEHLEYEVVSISGPAHLPQFLVHAKINSNVVGQGVGATKREAEQQAARDALALFGIRDDQV